VRGGNRGIPRQTDWLVSSERHPVEDALPSSGGTVALTTVLQGEEGMVHREGLR